MTNEQSAPDLEWVPATYNNNLIVNGSVVDRATGLPPAPNRNMYPSLPQPSQPHQQYNNNIPVQMSAASVVIAPAQGSEQQPAQANGEQQQPLIDSQNNSNMVLNSLYKVQERIANTEEYFVSKVPKEHSFPKIFFRISLILGLVELIPFLLWMVATPTVLPWFIYFWYAGVISVLYMYIWGLKEKGLSEKAFYSHLTFFVATSLTLWYTNEHVSSYPWAIYPIAVFLIIFLIHTLIVRMPKYCTLFNIHAICFAIGNSVLFVTYCFTYNFPLPWFLVILFGWLVILVCHFVFEYILWGLIKKSWNERRQRMIQQQLNGADNNPNTNAVPVSVSIPEGMILPQQQIQSAPIHMPLSQPQAGGSQYMQQQQPNIVLLHPNQANNTSNTKFSLE